MALSVQRAVAGLALGVTALGVNVSPANYFSLAAPAQAGTVATATLANLSSCVSKEEIFKRINNEGQYILVTGSRPAVAGSQVVQLKNVFTSDRAFKTGYHLSQNPAGNYCKIDRYYDVRLLDARGYKIDGRTIMPTNLANVKGSLSNAILSGSEAGKNPVLQYSSRFANNGSPARITISAEVGGDGLAMSSDNGGMVQDSFVLQEVNYTRTARQHLDSGTSSLAPSP